MKILIIPSENYVTKESPLSGIFQYHQAHFLKTNGYQVDVISFGFRSSKKGIKFEKSSIQYEYDEGINVYRYYKNKFLPMKFYKIDYYLKKIFEMGERVFNHYVKIHGMPNIIYAHNTIYAGVFAKYIKEKYGIPYIITEHSSLFLTGKLSLEQKLISFDVFKGASELSAVSLYLSKKIQELFPTLERKFINIGNVIDPLFVGNEKLENKDFSKTKFRFLNIANVNDNKDQLGIIDAFHKLVSNIDGFELVLGGDGPYISKVYKKIKMLGLENKVKVLGALSREEVELEMNNSNVFVLNSDFETFGVVIIEAMACGKPVLCSKCGGPEEFIKPFNGILFDKIESDALLNSMKLIVSNYNSYDSKVIKGYVLDQFYGENYLKKIELLLERVKNDCNYRL